MNTIQPIGVANIQKNVAPTQKNKEAMKASFAEKFEKIKSDEVRDKLQGVYEKIVNQSEKLGDKLYIKDLVEYKNLVKEFLDIAVTNSHAFSKENFLDRRGRHRVFSVVKQVDRELAGLTQDFLSQEKDRIRILKRLDDIRGILLDTFM